MLHMEHKDWLDALTKKHGSVRAVALAAGIDPSTLNRQRTRGTITADAVIAIARGLDLKPVQELVATGYLTPGEADSIDPAEALKWATDVQIAKEVLDRMNIGAGAIFDVPLDELTQADFDQAAPLVGDVDDTDDHQWDV